MLLVDLAQLACLRSQAIEGIVNKTIHNAHGLLGHSHFRVHLLQHLVDVDVKRFLAFLFHDLSFLTTPSFGHRRRLRFGLSH